MKYTTMSECAIRKVAKSDWMFKQLGRVNDGICGASGSKAAWTAIKYQDLEKRPMDHQSVLLQFA